MTLVTTFLPYLKMTEQVFSRRLAQLIEQVQNHPNRDEILALAFEQFCDDDYVVQQD